MSVVLQGVDVSLLARAFLLSLHLGCSEANAPVFSPSVSLAWCVSDGLTRYRSGCRKAWCVLD